MRRQLAIDGSGLPRPVDGRPSTSVQHRERSARWLWQSAKPIHGTAAERYLRSRCIDCDLASTLRFLPKRNQHPPALIAAFGVPDELSPGLLDLTHMLLRAVHLTKLREDGVGKPDLEPVKITLGLPTGTPIVLAPVNDLGALAIAEGIEDALSMYQACGFGAWAAGSANRLPALAAAVPKYVECVTVAVDDDDAGRHYAFHLRVNSSDYAGRILRFGLQTPRNGGPHERARSERRAPGSRGR